MGIRKVAKCLGAGLVGTVGGSVVHSCMTNTNMQIPNQWLDFGDRLRGLEGVLQWAGANAAYLAGPNGQNLTALGVVATAAGLYHAYRKFVDKGPY